MQGCIIIIYYLRRSLLAVVGPMPVLSASLAPLLGGPWTPSPRWSASSWHK